MKALAVALIVLLVVVVVIVVRCYKPGIEFFSSPISCRFVTLGTYKLTTTPITSASPNGQIYISSISATPSLLDWTHITHTNTNDQTYTYTDFTPLDLGGNNVKSLINAFNGLFCKLTGIS